MGKYVLNGNKAVRPKDYDMRMSRDGHCPMESRKVTKEFGSAMEMLHWCHANRVFCHVPGSSQGLEYLRLRVDEFSDFHPSAENLTAMREALARYRGILRYLREVEPEWQEVRVHHYMDNSIKREEKNKYGKTRLVTFKSPSGDICF